ncbi:MAG: hypothetical protein ACU841_10980 [Gammaproteobacteria bacterium]
MTAHQEHDLQGQPPDALRVARMTSPVLRIRSMSRSGIELIYTQGCGHQRLPDMARGLGRTE